MNKTMINFFRNIHKKLAAENKVMTYLQYAVGEFFLVFRALLMKQM